VWQDKLHQPGKFHRKFQVRGRSPRRRYLLGPPAKPRNLYRSVVITLAGCVLLALATLAAPAKRHVTRHWRGYGFLPGYRSSERIAWERALSRGPVYWCGRMGLYRGRWNGGGFGLCWMQIPIGPMWNCGW
jgi:hypothetical protein